MTKQEALKAIINAAVTSERLTGCPAELQAAQCILETGWLKSAPGNNCFGIKSYKGEHGRQLLTTSEWFTDQQLAGFLALGDGRTAKLKRPDEAPTKGKREYAVQDWFATFPTLAACFAKRAAMWDRGSYAAAARDYKVGGDLETLIRRIAPIYATDPKYADTLLKIIRGGEFRMALASARDTGVVA